MSDVAWLGCIDATIPNLPSRRASSGWIICTCSMRCRSSRAQLPALPLPRAPPRRRPARRAPPGRQSRGWWRRQPGGTGPAHQLHHLFRVRGADAGVIRLALIRLDHPRRARAECAVGENLDAADPQILVAEAPAQADRFRMVEQRNGQILHDAEVQLAALVQHLDARKASAPSKSWTPVRPPRCARRMATLTCSATCSGVGSGMTLLTSSIADSNSTPDGFPSPSRPMRPVAGSGVSAPICARRSAAELTHAAWPDCASRNTG